jgi:hypothetical protein
LWKTSMISIRAFYFNDPPIEIDDICLLINHKQSLRAFSVLDTTLWDKVCQWFATCWWFSPGTPVSSTNKTDCHDINEILLKVALNTIIQPTKVNTRDWRIKAQNPRETSKNHQHVANHWQTLSHNVVSSTENARNDCLWLIKRQMSSISMGGSLK